MFNVLWLQTGASVWREILAAALFSPGPRQCRSPAFMTPNKAKDVVRPLIGPTYCRHYSTIGIRDGEVIKPKRTLWKAKRYLPGLRHAGLIVPLANRANR